MLQCASCGGHVSEFAARCPACGHGIEDAGAEVELSPYLEDEHPVPAFEPRPLRPRRLHYAVGLIAVLLLVTGGVTAVLRPSSGQPKRIDGLRSLYGDIAAETPGGAVVSYEPATGRETRYILNGAPPRFRPVALSPDGTTWLGSDGVVLTVADGRVAHASVAVADGMPETAGPVSDPFSDGDSGVVVMSRRTRVAPSEASVVDVRNGSSYDLGPAEAAAGDPQEMGAFVSAEGVTGYDVELRRPGEAPQKLATAAQLAVDVGWNPDRPVRLAVYPSPTGEALAVVLTPLEAIGGDTPMAVLDRTGGLLAAIDDWRGPMYGARPVWSPGAHQLAYPTYTTSGPAVAVGTETGAFGTVSAPPESVIGPCVWSVSSTDVMCQARTGNRAEWLYALPTSGRLLASRSAGRPVGWVGGPMP